MPASIISELFKDDRYRVAWSIEEAEALKLKGWKDEKPEGHPYIPHTATEAPKPAEVVISPLTAAALAVSAAVATVGEINAESAKIGEAPKPAKPPKPAEAPKPQ